MGAWACKSCVAEDGHGYAARGWCGVGDHYSRSRIEWHPEQTARGTLTTAPAIAATVVERAEIASANAKPDQLSLF